MFVGDISRKDLRTNKYDRPESIIPISKVLDTEESNEVLYAMDLLTEEEKLSIINNLQKL